MLTNPGQRHCEARLACRGNLNSLHDLEFEIAALPLVARNDENLDFINKPERPGYPAITCEGRRRAGSPDTT